MPVILTQEARARESEVQDHLSYIVNSRPAWVYTRPCPKEEKEEGKEKQGGERKGRRGRGWGGRRKEKNKEARRGREEDGRGEGLER